MPNGRFLYFCTVKAPYLSEEALNQFIIAALAEDIGDGDHSSLGAIPEHKISRARLLVKDEGVLAGVEMAKRIFEHYDNRLEVKVLLQDGVKVKGGDEAFLVSGPARSILSTERLVLNCMQRMSGIASYTSELRNMISGTKAKLMDTRKTTPNFRIAEKWAVMIGGGMNHRFALYDMVMLKDNHIDMAGGIKAAIENTRAYLIDKHKPLKIEIETRSLEEVREVMAVGGVDIIMLDNMTIEVMEEAVKIIGGKYKTEASGGITEANIKEVAQTGVDYISVGALTHSVKSLDLSLKVY